MSRVSRVRRAGAALAVTTLLVAGASGPTASALAGDDAPGGISVSLDGRSWDGHLSPGAFDDVLVVPGAVVERDLWVRNDGPVRARLSIDVGPVLAPVVASRTTPDVAAAPGTTPGAAGDLGDWLSVRLGGEPVEPATRWAGPALAPGETTRVEVEVAMDAAAPAATRRSVADVLSAVHLVAVPVADPDAVGRDGDLAATGAGLTAVLGLAVAALCLGALLRRRLPRAGS